MLNPTLLYDFDLLRKFYFIFYFKRLDVLSVDFNWFSLGILTVLVFVYHIFDYLAFLVSFISGVIEIFFAVIKLLLVWIIENGW